MRIGFLILTQYPADTVIWIISMLLREASGFLGVVTIAAVAGGLGNWSIYEICLMFSLCAIVEAIGQAFFDNAWGIGHQVRMGRLDVMLVRPASPFIQLLGECFHFQALISMMVYVGLLVFSVLKMNLHVSGGMLLFLAEFLVCGTMINSGLYVIFNSLNFWLVQGNDIAVFVQTCREFAKYPLSVFPLLFRQFFTFVLPFGFVGYYPAAYLAGKMGASIVWQMPMAALCVGGIAFTMWHLGVGSYNSTGT